MNHRSLFNPRFFLRCYLLSLLNKFFPSHSTRVLHTLLQHFFRIAHEEGIFFGRHIGMRENHLLGSKDEVFYLLLFFCASTASFIRRMASSWLSGFEFLRSSRITSLGLLLWAKGFNGSSVTSCFIAHKYAKKLQLKINFRNSTHQSGLHQQPATYNNYTFSKDIINIL